MFKLLQLCRPGKHFALNDWIEKSKSKSALVLNNAETLKTVFHGLVLSNVHSPWFPTSAQETYSHDNELLDANKHQFWKCKHLNVHSKATFA